MCLFRNPSWCIQFVCSKMVRLNQCRCGRNKSLSKSLPIALMLTFPDMQGAEGRIAPLGRSVPALSNPHRIVGYSRRYTGPNGTCHESNLRLCFLVARENLPLLPSLKVIRLLAQTWRVTFLVSDCLAALAISPPSVGYSFIYLSSHSMLASIKEVPKSLPTAKSNPCPGGNHSFANTCTVTQCTETLWCKLGCH